MCVVTELKLEGKTKDETELNRIRELSDRLEEIGWRDTQGAKQLVTATGGEQPGVWVLVIFDLFTWKLVTGVLLTLWQFTELYR